MVDDRIVDDRIVDDRIVAHQGESGRLTTGLLTTGLLTTGLLSTGLLTTGLLTTGLLTTGLLTTGLLLTKKLRYLTTSHCCLAREVHRKPIMQQVIAQLFCFTVRETCSKRRLGFCFKECDRLHHDTSGNQGSAIGGSCAIKCHCG